MLIAINDVQLEHFTIAPSPTAPNNPHCPLLVYQQVLTSSCDDRATAFEQLFNLNQWPSVWRNGVFDFHHYHSCAHEVLGIYEGEVTVCFGGAGGRELHARAGDVIVVPAGVSHKRIQATTSLGIVGAYPAGQTPDTCQTLAGNRQRHAAVVARVPHPAFDPLYGSNGPLTHYWPTAKRA
jgi:uncharacterized protein YjlB